MHEMSIALALMELAEHHRPAGTRVLRVEVHTGPLQAIESEAMQFAWQAATTGTSFAAAVLDLRVKPWRLKCHQCGRRWEADVWDSPCICGAVDPLPSGSDELLLVSLDVEPDATPVLEQETIQ